VAGVDVVLCANPASGGGSDSPEAVAASLRAHGAAVTVREIADLGDPGAFVPPAAAAELVAGAQRLVVAGGDGSIGLAASAAAAAGVPLAVVPSGTANDFARALALPTDLDAACALAADPGAPVRPLDLGAAGARPFVNAAGAGLAPAAARSARPLKGALGPLAYAVGALHAGATAHPLGVRVEVDGAEVYAGDAWQLVVANTGAFGGGSSTGAADAGDGALDLAVVPSGSRLTLVRRAYGMRTGRLVHQDDVVHARGARVVVTGAETYNIDGEVCHPGPPAEFTVRPRAFGLAVPGGATP
jgi:diacylglycerol kinase family enzyme